MESTESAPVISYSDYQIIERILNGEQRLFELIIRRYNARLYRIGMSMLNDAADAEDAMQAAYIKAYEHLRDFQGKSEFSTWLTRILINECLQYLKKKKKRVMMQNDHDLRRTLAGAVTQLPEKALLNQELTKVLEESLAQLPEKYRLVFVMREVEDMSIAETMAALDLSESNVKVRLNRAKAMLRKKLIGYYQPTQLYHFHLTRCDNMVNLVMQQLNIPSRHYSLFPIP